MPSANKHTTASEARRTAASTFSRSSERHRSEDIFYLVGRRRGTADADPQPGEIRAADSIDHGPHAVVAPSTTVRTKPKLSDGQVHVVVDCEQIVLRGPIASQQRLDGSPALVHEGAWLGQHHRLPCDHPLADLDVPPPLGDGDGVYLGQVLYAPETYVVSCVSVPQPWVTQSRPRV